MDGVAQIKAFARDFVNGKGRTPERKALIRSTYRQHFGSNMRANCITCYIEAVLKIIRIMETKACHYRLKKGVILQPFGKGIITNDNLTDEIAAEALRTKVANPSMFAIMPFDTPDLEIVPPAAEDQLPPAPVADTPAPGDIAPAAEDQLPPAPVADTPAPGDIAPADAAPTDATVQQADNVQTDITSTAADKVTSAKPSKSGKK
jgi:hypothetical protein